MKIGQKSGKTYLILSGTWIWFSVFYCRISTLTLSYLVCWTYISNCWRRRWGCMGARGGKHRRNPRRRTRTSKMGWRWQARKQMQWHDGTPASSLVFDTAIQHCVAVLLCVCVCLRAFFLRRKVTSSCGWGCKKKGNSRARRPKGKLTNPIWLDVKVHEASKKLSHVQIGWCVDKLWIKLEACKHVFRLVFVSLFGLIMRFSLICQLLAQHRFLSSDPVNAW